MAAGHDEAHYWINLAIFFIEAVSEPQLMEKMFNEGGGMKSKLTTAQVLGTFKVDDSLEQM